MQADKRLPHLRCLLGTQLVNQLGALVDGGHGVREGAGFLGPHRLSPGAHKRNGSQHFTELQKPPGVHLLSGLPQRQLGPPACWNEDGKQPIHPLENGKTWGFHRLTLVAGVWVFFLCLLATAALVS